MQDIVLLLIPAYAAGALVASGLTAEESREATAFAFLTLLSAVVVAPLWLLDVPNALRFAYSALAFALPTTLLLSNRELACPRPDGPRAADQPA